tara:strand:+ start:32 stop:511 length:480 start_codon:yes stop_codon:yes gene_type:complete
MIVSAKIDEKELKQIIKDLDRLFPNSDTKLRATLRSALRKSATPLRTELRSNIKTDIKPTRAGSEEKKTGQLVKSVAIINGKTKGGLKPSVFIGPRVTGKFSARDKTGFYFYFHEYGFYNAPPLRMLEKTASSKGQQVMDSVISKLKTIIEKRFAKKFK